MKNNKQKSVISKQPVWERHNIIYFIFLLTVYFLLATFSYAEEVNSRAAVVIEASTGRILYAKNPNLRLPPASTTKLITAIVAIENADLKDIVRVSKNASHVSPSKAGFKEGDKVTIETLLYAALLKSANDAAVALAEAVAGSEARFVDLMNKKAVEIGARDTRFINPHGLPGQGQYTTAFDLSKIMSYALMYPKLKEVIGTRVAEVSTEDGNAIFLKNTNKLLWSDDDLVGGKTGYTRRARHCIVCAAERGGNSVIVAVLGSPSRNCLWQEAEMMVQKGFKVIAKNEEPDIYFVREDYDALYLKGASYKKSSKSKVQSSKSKTYKKVVAKKKVKNKKTKVRTKKKVKDKEVCKRQEQ
jgi:D-alanyl-D-alanine carboxypeptidase (penicillin-binding protein 5/6)